ncbi:hypothetical protein SESBI_00989 [Sesbania bispinosa]|nr:hypothetical protein SESBI_00989 [Sesbania bispinosa]
MAEATRHQAAVREAEERIMAAVNPRFEAMEHRMDDLQELVRGLGMQISELGQNQNQVWRNRGEHNVSTRFTKLEFPRFTREDVNGWISKCERFFALDDTPEGNKVTLASIAMDEVSYQWFQGFERSFSGRITWETWFHIQQKYPHFAAAQHP